MSLDGFFVRGFQWLLAIWFFSREWFWRSSFGKTSDLWCLGELLSLVFRSICIQDVWTEQRFPLSSYEASGVWSYRLACEAATISLVCRSGDYRVAGYRQQR
ncbi:hypothetical protein Bca4012_093254 [Brassica carinata]